MSALRRTFSAVLVPLAFLFTMGPLQAAHYSGGSITYECLGGNMYQISLDVFLDCSGVAITSQDLTFTNSCGVSFTLTNIPQVSSEEVSQLCPGSLANSTCNGGALPGFTHYTFQTTLFLSPCNFWTIAWDICCRNDLQNVQGTPGIYLEATLNNAGGLCDQSPAFAENTIPFFCVNQPVNYNLGATDANGNTMVFSLVEGQTVSPLLGPLDYEPGYSGAEPIPGITIDPTSGQLSFTPTVTGNYAIVVEVATYNASGVLIGTVLRDVMIVVQNCNDPPPSTTGLNNANGGLITGASTIEVCDGIPFCVDLPFSDPDPATVITAVSNVTAQLPGATFTLSGTNPLVATICWTPDPAFSPANVLVTATDNACPIANVVSSSVFITVVQPPPTVPDAGISASVSSCSGGAAVNLFAQLGGSPDAGGIWTAPDGSSHSGLFTPGVDAFGVYTYVVGNACDNASATVTVSSAGGPNAGTNGTLTVCSNGAPVALIGQLGGTPDAGGTWSGPSPVVGGLYAPATMNPGVYTYTVTGVAPCANVTSTVTVTENAAPNAGTNGSLAFCSNGAAAALATGLGGTPQAGGAWSGPSAVVAGQYNPATMAPGAYVYTVTGIAPCANATATVTVTENPAPNAGTNGTLTLCSNGASVALSTGLGGTPQAGGTWSGPSAVVGGQYNPATMAPGAYVYTVAGLAPCANATATVTVAETAAPNAGTNGTLTVCSNGASVALSTGLGGTPQAGGAWSGPSAVVGGQYDPATMTPGAYVYTVTGVAPCTNATATVTVTENAATNAGTDGSITVCDNGAAVDLFAQLGGTPQAGGAWSGPSAVVGGQYDPATMTPGAYTYTVTGVAPCTNATATVTVTENAATNAGTAGSITVCDNGAAIDLFAQLGGTPQGGGTWNGPSAVVGGQYDPATMTPGAYTYTVTGVAPCTNASATVTVTESTGANAGSDGSVTVCESGAAVDLFAQLGGTPQAGGTWSGPSAVVGGQYDPATMTPGAYTYTVLGIAPCTNASATVTVTESTGANAGSDGSVTVCESGSAIDLFAELGGTPQAGGTWSGPSAVVGGQYDPATMTPGAYTYTVTGVAPCTNASATVTVTESTGANAGSDGSVTVCESGAAVDLFAQLGGTPQAGGTWSGPSAVVGGQYDPATMTPGAYTYTVLGIAPCTNASATVTVTESTGANAGSDGSVTVCESGPAIDLFAQLGGTPQAGGAWSGPSAVVAGQYDPATMTPGAYTYTVTGVAPCTNATATVTVTENAATNAGTDGSITVCDNGAAIDLFAQLGGTPQAGGAWSGPSAVVGGQYDPATMTPGAYTYTVTGVVPCTNATATVTVTENAATNAGTDGAITICDNGAAIDLFAQLGGTPQAGGAWSGPSAVVGGQYDPATMTPGAYVYTVTGVAPCTNATATVTVTENAATNAGTDGSITVCDNGASVDLFVQLGGTPQAGGTWSGPSAVVGGQYDPATMTPGAYSYTVIGVAPCTNATATVTVTENAATNAGTDGSITVCDNGASIDLFAQLGGTPQAGGAWSGPSAVVGGQYDPSTMTPGAYTYTVTGVVPCTNATATVTVTENAATNAGTDGSITVCDNGAAIDLFAQLGGTPQAGGTWNGPSAVVGGQYDPATMTPGAYSYTVIGVAPCTNATATVTVTENAATNAGTAGSITVCDNGAAVDLFAQLGGTPQAGGAWSGPSALVGGQYDPATMTPGAYAYTVLGIAPCTNASATVTVTESTGANAGSDGSVIVCESGSAIDLFAQLGGTPQAGGAWSGPSAVVGGQYDPATMTPGAYTYTVTGVAPCTNASATVTVTESTGANAGSDGSVTLCESGSAIDLFAELGGTPQAGGTWSGPSAVVGGQYDPATMTPGAYTYTVLGIAPCTNATATVTVTESTGANAGSDGSVTVCESGSAIDLFAQLGGTPQAGGAWSGPSVVVGGQYDPATMTPGAYTYTVTGVAPCTNASATVTVTESTGANAGSDGSVTVCESGAAVDLFAQLGGTPQAGGAWSGPSAVVAGQYDPATMTPGAYTYTVLGIAPCTNAIATVTVTESTGANAGSDGSVTVCESGAAVDLFAQLGGTPQAGGAWSGPSAVVGGQYDPSTMTPGAYTYTVTGTAPCADASAVVTVTGTTVPDAGQDAAVTVCSTSGVVDLFAQLGGTPQTGGTWTDAAGVTVSGFFDPAASTSGPFTYSIDGGACPTETAVVDVTVESAPDAGDDGSITLCSSGGTFSLISGLGGTPSAVGIWTDASGLQVADVFDPAVQAGGQFTYTVTGAAICPSDASTLQITVVLAPLAGSDGSLTLCASSPITSLFDGLGGTLDAGGTWTDPSGAPHGTVVDPAVDPAGPYVYTVLGTAPCPNATATVDVVINPEPFAGDDGEATYCSNDAVVELFQVLGGTPQQNGTWSAPSGATFNGLFDPTSGQPGVYVYTVTGSVPCGSDQAQVTVMVTTAPDAGSDGAITLCAQDAPVDLFAQLGGTPQPTGSWTGPDGQQVDAAFDPSVDAPGIYVYTVQGVAPCGPVTAEVVVTVVPPPVADIQVLSNGSCAPATVVLAHAYTGPGNCTWILGNGQVVEDCAPVTAVYELPGSYDVTLIVDAGNGCGADTLTLEDLVTVYVQPTAQFDPLPAQINTLDPEVFFHNTSSGAVGYSWSVDGAEVSTEGDLRYMFPAELGNSYVVCLAAIASPNCADSLCRVIEVEDGLGVFVPNSFTPNDDDINETFGPVLLGIDPRFYSFMIFDRWGLEVFSTTDPTARWNGRSPDGTELPVDVYVWKLVTKDAYSGARIERLGHVSLVR